MKALHNRTLVIVVGSETDLLAAYLRWFSRRSTFNGPIGEFSATYIFWWISAWGAFLVSIFPWYVCFHAHAHAYARAHAWSTHVPTSEENISIKSKKSKREKERAECNSKWITPELLSQYYLNCPFARIALKNIQFMRPGFRKARLFSIRIRRDVSCLPAQMSCKKMAKKQCLKLLGVVVYINLRVVVQLKKKKQIRQ